MYNRFGNVDKKANYTGGDAVQGQKGIGQYRGIDLFLFAVLLAVFETVIVKAAVSWFPREAWMVSAVPAVAAIVMVRWGPWCAVHAVLGGVVTTAAVGGGWQQYLIYGIGNLAVLAVLPLEKKWGWKKLRESTPVNLLFGALAVLAMQLGRAVVALVLGLRLEAALRLVTTDSITYIFTLAIVWAASRPDGLLEDQVHYLKRLSHEPDGKEGAPE